MPSTLSWLDTSAEEQRRVRELVALYSQKESRDELGIGQIRDAFANGLFPGTSTVHTRARYFLFIPWIFTLGATKRTGRNLTAWTDIQERRLINALVSEGLGPGDGVIGRVAGSSLTTLPSTIYWSALRRYGILTRDVSPGMLGTLRSPSRAGFDDELAVRSHVDWHPTLPAAPEGFPAAVSGGMAMRTCEAAWLRDRILDSVPGTLLAHLLIDDTPITDEDVVPWFSPACLTADGPPATLLHHGHLFSLVMHGAALLYNLLVAEQYEDAGHTTVPEPVERYRGALSSWAESVQAYDQQIKGWDHHEMLNLVRTINPQISMQTRAFVEAWIDVVRGGPVHDLAEHDRARTLVEKRERRQKGGQSRLVNDRLLRTWSGASGTAEMMYRWPQVRRMVTDIREGIARAGA